MAQRHRGRWAKAAPGRMEKGKGRW
jgi:hypothetical protein